MRIALAEDFFGFKLSALSFELVRSIALSLWLSKGYLSLRRTKLYGIDIFNKGKGLKHVILDLKILESVPFYLSIL